MGKAYCSSEKMEFVEDYICNGRPKLSVVTPYMIERDTGLDHMQAAACLDSFAPLKGQVSTFELCTRDDAKGHVTGEGRWLVKSTANPNEYWIDEPDACMVWAIKSVDARQLPYPQKEKLAAGLFLQCQKDQELRNERILRTLGVAAGTGLAVDGFRRITLGEGIGAAELGLGLVIDMFSVFA